MPLLEVKNLEVSYGGISAVKGIDLEVGEGELVCLIGANGAGKSSTLKAITRLLPARAAKLCYAGDDISRAPVHALPGRGLAMVPEGRGIFPQLTVDENLAMGAYSRGARTADAQYERFPRLKERRHQVAGTLSGGEQQMLALGRALMSEPRLLLLDEPSLGIAPILVQEIFAEIRRINRDLGTTILLVEQNAHIALSLARRGYVLETGRIVLEDAAASLLADPQVREAYLG